MNLRAAFVFSLVIATPLIAQVEEKTPPAAAEAQAVDQTPRLEEAATKASEPARKLRLITNATTLNYVAKFDGVGDPTDSTIFEDASGQVGMGTPDPKARLHVYGAATGDVFLGIGPDPSGVTGPAMNLGYGGFSFGRGAGFFNVRPDSLAVPPNPSLRFGTANVERMIITNTGWVGVGTSAPTQKLHVFANEDAGTVVQVENTNTGDNAHAAFRTTSSLAATSYVAHGNRPTSLVRFGIPLAGWSEIVNYNGNGHIIGTGPNTPLVFGTNNVERMRILGNGNVGIGTTTPTAMLHVVGDDGTGNPTILVENMGNAAANVHLTTHRTSVGNAGILRFKYFDTGANLVEAGTVSGTILDISPGTRAGGLIFSTQSPASTVASEKMRIDSAGNVGIGITSPTAKLHVVGDIITTGNITGAKVIGAVYQDLAEWVPATSDMTPGTVVVLNLDKTNEVMPSSRQYDTSVAGVVSASPGIILGVAGDSKEQIATTGRVKVRVDARTKPVRVGDLLVTSDVLGTAMRSEPMEINGRQFHQPGTIIGKALEPLENSVGEILVLLSMQ